MKRILILVLIFFCGSSFAQEIQILEKIDHDTEREKVERFGFIDDKLDLSNYNKLVVLKGYTQQIQKKIH